MGISILNMLQIIVVFEFFIITFVFSIIILTCFEHFILIIALIASVIFLVAYNAIIIYFFLLDSLTVFIIVFLCTISHDY